jgi:hypothetical protein
MTPEERIEDKLTKILEGDVTWVREHRQDMKDLGVRVGMSEIKAAQHEVRLDRVDDDLGGLSRKIRAHADSPHAAAAQPVIVRDSGSWLDAVEFLVTLPKWVHWTSLAVAAVLGILGLHSHVRIVP